MDGYQAEAGEVPLLIRPDVRKLTQQDDEAMLADLMQWSTGWLAPSPGPGGGRSRPGRMLKRVSAWLRSTWLAELEPAPGQVAGGRGSCGFWGGIWVMFPASIKGTEELNDPATVACELEGVIFLFPQGYRGRFPGR